jgi:ferredoxin
VKLNIDLGSCVKALSKNSNCTNCADICPENSITFLENIPQVANSCTDCGLCLGVCPTEAITLKGFDTLESIFGMLEKKEQTITCEKELPCVGIYHVEHLLSLALLNTHQTLKLECCEACFEITQTKVKEVKHLLESLQSSKEIETTLTIPTQETQETTDNLV